MTARALFSKVRGPMGRDPASVDADLVARLLERSRPAGDHEVRAALAELTPGEEKKLRRALLDPPAARLGPFAWADIARGIEPQVAVAREISGYYALRAERDALAAMVRAPPTVAHRMIRPSGPSPEPRVESESGPPAGARRKRAKESLPPRSQYLLGLFAYHRDAPLVARALGVSLEDLGSELEALGIRRKAFRLARETNARMPMTAAAPGPAGPPVRRRTPAPAPGAKEPAAAPEPDELRALLASLGPRRDALRERLGLSEPALLARLRESGLEREFALRERDLIRGLWSKLRSSEERVASELGIAPLRLREIVRERGLTRELEGARERLRRAARSSRWPGERIAMVLHREHDLRELDLYDEMRGELAARVAVLWKSLQGKPQALELLRKKLHLTEADAERLRTLLQLS